MRRARGTAARWWAAGDASREAAVRFIARDVDCGGGTNLPAGLLSASQLGAGRLVLVTDGDLNMAADDVLSGTQQILGSKGHCPGLTVVGIAPRTNTMDRQILQAVADQEGGTYRTAQVEEAAALVTSDKPEADAATP